MVAIDLSLMDKLLSRVLFPEWAMMAAIKVMSLKKFIHFSLWLGRLTMGTQFLGQDEATIMYLEQCMFQIKDSEYLKLWRSLYGFTLRPLESIICPTLVLNGEYESKSMTRHTQELLRRIPLSESRIIPTAYHALNLDNVMAFNEIMEDFLHSIG
jgi:pimeloyl-ACP methyl ester carboxylesterase